MVLIIEKYYIRNISVNFFVSITKANVGNMDCAKRQWKLIGGNLALVQVKF